MAKRKGLGRGLDALLGGAAPSAVLGVAEEGELRRLPIDRVTRGPFQPRASIDPEALEELARSVRAQGIIQPVLVRPAADGVHYELIAGERRWRAAQAAGLDEVPALVREVSDQAAMATALIENIQREALNPIEEARALRRLIDECHLTHQAAAEAIGRSRAAVTNSLRLLELEADVAAALAEGRLEMGHARALLGLTGRQQSEAARRVLAKGLSVRETERLVRSLREGEARERPRRAIDPDVRRLEEDLSAELGARVRIRHTARGSGRLVVEYATLEQLDGLLARFRS